MELSCTEIPWTTSRHDLPRRRWCARLAWASMEPFGGRYVERNLWPKLPQPNIFRLCAVILSQPVATLPNSVEQATSAT
jgi:hypothetical protein